MEIVLIISFILIFIVLILPLKKENQNYNNKIDKEVLKLLKGSIDIKIEDGKNKALYHHNNDYNVLNSSLDRHAQIINESINIIKRSNNIDTINSRYNVVVENWNMAMKYRNSVIPSDPNFISQFKKDYNENIVRAVRENFINYQNKIRSLKTMKAVDNNTEQMFELIEKSKSILSDSEDKKIYEILLDNIHYDIQEEYSNLTLK